MMDKVVKDVIFYSFFNGLYVSSICTYYKYVIITQNIVDNTTKIGK